MGTRKVFETVNAEATTRFYNGVPVNIANVDGVEYIGQQNVFHATSVDVSSAVVKHCNDIKYVNGRKAFPIKDFGRMSFSNEPMCNFIRWLLSIPSTETRTPNLRVAPVVPIHSKMKVVYKTPPQVYEYIEDLLDENAFLIKELQGNVNSTRALIKEAEIQKEGLQDLKKVLEIDDKEADESVESARILTTNWLNNLEWDYLSPANFSKLWGVYDLVVTISEADKKLHQKKTTDDSAIWMAFSRKISKFAVTFGVVPIKNTVSKKVEHKYNKSKSTNIFPLWVLELYFEEQYGPCRNKSIPDQREAINWVENTIGQAHGCGGRLKSVV